MRSVPYINLAAQHAPLKGALLEAVGKVLDHGNFILGDEVAVFERTLADYCGTRYAVGVNSGTDALILALKALGIGPGDEVITSPNSFLATALAIEAVGAKTVFADIRGDLNIDPEQIEACCTPRTRAILPVHLGGKPAAMEPILEIARLRHLAVIEDAAQSVGAEYRGKKTGSLGTIGCFSLHPLKTLNACGDAGAITLNDASLAEKMRQLRNIGLKNRDESDTWGCNSRLDSLQAAILNVKMGYLEKWTRARRANAAIYREALRDIVEVPEEEPQTRHVYHTFMIQTDERDALQSFLADRGIGTKVHYPIPIHLQACAAKLGYRRGDFPVCERACRRILSLPVYPELSREDLAYVIGSVREFFEAEKGLPSGGQGDKHGKRN